MCIRDSIVYIRDAEVDEGFAGKFDYVVYHMGLNENSQDAEFSFILNDYSRSGIHNMQKAPKELLDSSYFIMRDKVSNKVTERDVIKMLEINEDQVLGYIPLDEKDEVAYMNFSHTGRQRIKNTSVDMQLAVMTALSIVTGEDMKTVKKYYRKAKRVRRI